MVNYLQRLKHKKGFTMVELVVAIAIIAVLTAIILVNALGGNIDAVLTAKSSAEAFFTATQLTFTRAQLTERTLVEYAEGEIPYIEYKEGINKIKDDTYLFVEVKCGQNGVIGTRIDKTFNSLMSKGDITGEGMTALEEYIGQNLDKYLYESYDGYFYAAVDNNFKVLFTHFCRKRLPAYEGNLDDFKDNLMVSNDRVKGNDEILGSCSDTYAIAVTGDYVFALPDKSSPDYGKYLA